MSSIRILFLAANPKHNGGRLALDEEVRAIQQRLLLVEHRDQIELISKWAVRPDDLTEALLRHQPHVVHFSGHSGAAGICLVGDDGEAHPVPGRVLAMIFKVLRDNIRLIVFNACYAEVQARAVTEHIELAIGMREKMGDDAARVFAAELYRGLGYGRSVQGSFDLAIAALASHHMAAEHQPVLIKGTGADPGVVLVNG